MIKTQNSVYNQFLKVLLPLCSCVFILIISVFEWVNFQESKQKLHTKLIDTTTAYSLLIADSIYSNNKNELGLMTISLISDPDIAGFRVTDTKNVLIETYGMTETTQKQLTAKRRINYSNTDGFQQLGFFTLSVTEANIVSTLKKRIYYEIVLLFSLIIIVIIGTKIAYKRAIGKPLKSLVFAINHFDEKNTHQNIKNQSNDELGLVINAYNNMQNTRIKISKQLSDSHNLLEQHVKERTADLHSEISRHKKTSELLFEAQQRVEVTLNTIADAVISTDLNGKIVFANNAAELLLEETHHHILGKNIAPLLTLKNFDSDKPLASIMERSDIDELSNDTLKAVFHSPSKKRIFIELIRNVLVNVSGVDVGFSFVIRDITETWKHAEKLTYLASHDTLTGLLNRREFDRLLDLSIINAETFDNTHALCFIDLDRFKIVNDSHGHLAGDELLKNVAHEFKQILRKGDYLSRLGGDEFSVLLMNCSAENAMLIMEKMRVAIEKMDFLWDGEKIQIGISAGVTSIYSGCGTIENILSRADASCYISKRSGRNQVQLFHKDRLNQDF